MSQENVEIVQRGYEQFATTRRFVAELARPDFVWDMSNFRGWPEQQTYEGVAGAEAFSESGSQLGISGRLRLRPFMTPARRSWRSCASVVDRRRRTPQSICTSPRYGRSTRASRPGWRC